MKLDDLLRQAATRISGDTSCSVILRQGPGLLRVASGDERSARCDDVEVREGQGPCVLAMDQLRGVLVPDLTGDERWPPWRAEALRVGFRSAAALPALVAPDTSVAVNLDSSRIDPWDTAALVRADQAVQEVARGVADLLAE